MNLMYVDESGDDGFPQSGIWQPNIGASKVFIRTRLVLHDWEL